MMLTVNFKASWVFVRGCCLALLISLAGCAGLFQEPLTAIPEDQRQSVLESLREKEDSIRTLRGLFQASVSGSGIPFSQNFNGMVSYVSPDRVHLRGFLRFGVPMMDFHREGNEYQLYFPTENKFVTGHVDGGDERTQWDQTVQLSIRALDAVLGKIAGLAETDIRISKSTTHYRLDWVADQTSGDAAQEDFLVRTWVDVKTLELTSIEYRQSYDGVVISVECEDYRDVKTPSASGQERVRLPFVVTATDHRSGGGSITLNFQEFVLNAA
jgi:hypothetical protein